MLFSIVVPTCNRPAALRECLRGLSTDAQKADLALYEVIVTDDASDDSLRDILAADFPWVTWNRGPQRGPAANRNSGAQASRGEWLIFLDDDCLPDSSLLSGYQEAISKNAGVQAFEGAIHESGPRTRMDEEAPINLNGGFFWTCNVMVRRVLFSNMKGFCELFRFAMMEDVDFQNRLKQLDKKIVFVPNASVIHPWRQMHSGVAYVRKQILAHRILYQRHPEARLTFSVGWSFIYRDWTKAIIVDGPSLHFRGFGPRLSRLLCNTWIMLSLVVRS